MLCWCVKKCIRNVKTYEKSEKYISIDNAAYCCLKVHTLIYLIKYNKIFISTKKKNYIQLKKLKISNTNLNEIFNISVNSSTILNKLYLIICFSPFYLFR